MRISKNKMPKDELIGEKLFSEQIYSEEGNHSGYFNNNELGFKIQMSECPEYRKSSIICGKDYCYNRSFFRRLTAYNYSDREKFIHNEIQQRENRFEFLGELKNALYDTQNSFEEHIYKHYLKIIEEQEIKLTNGQTPIKSNKKGNKVFIIHGHDEEMKRAVQLFISRIDLDDVVLHERPNGGRTIINKLIEESEDACFAIALFSPDDSLEDGTRRARQNVILELGYFIGLMGIERVRILKKGKVEIPSDLSGVIYEEYDAEGAWRIKLAKEMKDIGIEINDNALIQNF